MASTLPPLHVVVTPLPAQGHANPFFHLAKLLATRGFFITFINTEWIEERIFRPPNDAAEVSRRLQQQGMHFRFLTLPDGLPPHHPRHLIINEFFEAMHKLSHAMVRLLQSRANEAPPITCIITDSLFACTEEMATVLGVPRVIFWTFSCSASIVLANSQLLLDKGLIPVNVKDAERPESFITCLPGNIPPVKPKDLMVLFQEKSDPMFEIMMYISDTQKKADYMLVNVFEELEGPEAVAGLSYECPAFTIGPVFLQEFLEAAKSSLSISTSLWEDDLDYLKWLDTQELSSVLYVSFGSIAVMSTEQLQELALGLEASQQPFLWVVRADIADGQSAVLPEGFRERVNSRETLVGWAPELKVLGHPSVGGLLTRNGWNSTPETISMGVPMIRWPLWAEQLIRNKSEN
ncbi:7-deoxyloganetin glucosyltransferase-like [Cryptomeria japonica]|uniref:7-deoxyloganetin glucosyltransferase-like n=1 Tax=Cryptomeria japonica TaxID=3369 RepID=UPI0027DA58E0|nr:7-deoxyloganetin glucosyltransferase-like [Cryptomeria japonica]